MTIKYPAWLCALAVLVAACAPQAIAPSLSPTPAPTASAASSPGLPAALGAQLGLLHRWYTVPDALISEYPVVTAIFDGDPTGGSPRVRLSPGGAEFPFTPSSGNVWHAVIALTGLAPGDYTAQLVQRVRNAGNVPSAKVTFFLSQPEYVVWTLDFEGDASGDAELANTAAIADGLKIPMSVFWNPRVWTTSQVSTERQDAMLKWTKDRQAQADEVALHLHMWTDYVRAAGLVPRTSPSWAGRGDGYDVPMTAYSEAEQKALIDYGLRLMADHGLPRPTSFRAGGDIGDAATLRAVAAAGFTADCTAVAKDYPPIGRVPYPWTLPSGAQPYRPSAADANAAGDLPLVEAPTIGGNTYAFTVQSIQPQIRANLALFAPAGSVATVRKAITVVSHPGTIVPVERAAIEALLGAFGPLRYDADSGPVRFVTLRDLAAAYR
ncbi:MAG TPA: DUF2334 domain-containing protein [Candidatus Limnocylindria bacterium]|nr:DUF2334 domain-containing protein [Candidatus Limnocylindria bacterium]